METIHFSIRPSPPFRLDLTVWVLQRRPNNRLDSWDGHTYRKVLSLGNQTVLAAIEQKGDFSSPELAVSLTCENPSPSIESASRSALTRLLGTDLDLSGFYRMAAGDRDLSLLSDRFLGVKPPRYPTLFEAFANGIVCQQISLYAGLSILNRLIERYGRPFILSDTDFRAFPEAASIASCDFEEIRQLGFSANKARTLVETAKIISAGELTQENLERMDNATAFAALVNIRGIGKWTADYVLLRGLGRIDVFPGNDVGALKGLSSWLSPDRKLSRDQVADILARWRPYAGLVYFHLLLRGLADHGFIK